MTFASDLKHFTVVVKTRSNHVAAGMVAAVHESITVGSPATGAPGQPVDTENLRESWIPVVYPDGSGGHTSTPVIYAPIIEEGMMLARAGQVTGNTGQRLTLRSPTGGFHSVKMTVAGADALLRQVVGALG